ncbi:hypothetical protein POI8812_01222 [Pontivivens insulae]|uniref:Uncharacterized protein n=1 Tax=Pontivivens insulae TaxID=1639689 RepID=A0A2R8A9L9_9RHOB|nr:hypothetical protein DFR53_1959 [Pontivivens insulae]SPF28919.1 hypothetical protein POI8812_01222 [Pontivivens insulae]
MSNKGQKPGSTGQQSMPGSGTKGPKPTGPVTDEPDKS